MSVFLTITFEQESPPQPQPHLQPTTSHRSSPKPSHPPSHHLPPPPQANHAVVRRDHYGYDHSSVSPAHHHSPQHHARPSTSPNRPPKYPYDAGVRSTLPQPHSEMHSPPRCRDAYGGFPAGGSPSMSAMERQRTAEGAPHSSPLGSDRITIGLKQAAVYLLDVAFRALVTSIFVALIIEPGELNDWSRGVQAGVLQWIGNFFQALFSNALLGSVIVVAGVVLAFRNRQSLAELWDRCRGHPWDL
ncbi:MAG: hypothetical protein SGPRY_013730, partial [Prymnesium sp.]